jgi:hypothetical protein
LVAAYVVAAPPAMAGKIVHDWKMVPERPDVLVDMASIRPSIFVHMKRPGPPPPDTAVTVRFKGLLLDNYDVDCEPGVTFEGGDGEYRIENRLVGYTPDGKIRAMVCPIRHAD